MSVPGVAEWKTGPEHHALGQAIRARRAKLGLSQEALADAAGVHRTYVGGVERGERNVAYANLRRLAHALGCRGSELLAEAEALE